MKDDDAWRAFSGPGTFTFMLLEAARALDPLAEAARKRVWARLSKIFFEGPPARRLTDEALNNSTYGSVIDPEARRHRTLQARQEPRRRKREA